jgi:penicillin-binding protein 1A
MVGAYGTFVNKGVFTEPIFITRIEDRQGNVIANFVPAVSDAISEQTAYTMVQMLQNNVVAGTGGRLRSVYGFRDGDLAGEPRRMVHGRDAQLGGGRVDRLRGPECPPGDGG